MIVSLELAKLHLRVDGDEEDSLVTAAIEAAEYSAANFLNRHIYPDQTALDAADDPTGLIINPAIRAAILLIAGRLFAVREDLVIGQTVAELPQGSRDLLWPYRIGLGI